MDLHRDLTNAFAWLDAHHHQVGSLTLRFGNFVQKYHFDIAMSYLGDLLPRLTGTTTTLELEFSPVACDFLGGSCSIDLSAIAFARNLTIDLAHGTREVLLPGRDLECLTIVCGGPVTMRCARPNTVLRSMMCIAVPYDDDDLPSVFFRGLLPTIASLELGGGMLFPYYYDD